MDLQVSFRVVGLYCYFENLQLPGVSPTSTVKEVMDAIALAQPAFSYQTINTGGKELVSELDYTFSDASTQPYNTGGRPANGPRDLSVVFGPKSLVWQYYRSVTGTMNGSVCEIKLISQGQPSFATTPLNFYDPFFGQIPEGFVINTYNLTWRLVQIQMSPENQAKYMIAMANSLK
jgi:hypothetical protein